MRMRRDQSQPLFYLFCIKDNYNNWKETIDGGLDVGKIADCVLFAYNMPQDICVREIVVAKTKQQD